MKQPNRGGWKTCSRGHKYRRRGPCPICWPSGRRRPDAGLKKFLLATEKRYTVLYERVTALLNKEYFRDPNGKSKG